MLRWLFFLFFWLFRCSSEPANWIVPAITFICLLFGNLFLFSLSFYFKFRLFCLSFCLKFRLFCLSFCFKFSLLCLSFSLCFSFFFFNFIWCLTRSKPSNWVVPSVSFFIISRCFLFFLLLLLTLFLFLFWFFLANRCLFFGS